MRRKIMVSLAFVLTLLGTIVLGTVTAPPALAASEFVFNISDCCTNANVGFIDSAGVTRQILPGRSSYTQYKITEIRFVKLASNVCAKIRINNGTEFFRGPGSKMTVQNGQSWKVNPVTCL